MPSDWSPAFSEFLQAVGWPGDRGIDSLEYQTLEVWRELLSELARLDRVLGRIAPGIAVGLLRRLSSARQFQPESEPAPVQILGVLESSGLRFDRLWIMGMHDNAWPAARVPDPFLPFRLQHRFSLPRSSPDRELEFARALTARLLSSAPTVVVSYPMREGDSDLRVSPLLTALPKVTETGLGLPASAGYPEQLLHSSRMETIQDHSAPPCGTVQFRAGTSLFKLQAACPFRAFAELRLAAHVPDQPEPGLNALDRGHLVHRILEHVWEKLRSHQGLVSMSEEGLTDLVRSEAEAEIRKFSRRRRILRNARFAAIERVRIEHIIGQWLLLEKERQPFTMLEQETGRRVTLGGLQLNIRADRVDRLKTGELVILDYKTGDCSPSDWDGSRPDEPQLPIYAVTADSPVAGVLFGRLKSGKLGFRGLASSDGMVPGVKAPDDQPALEETIEEWREVLDRLGREFRAGNAIVDPKQPRQTCRHCALPALCRIGQASAEVEEKGD
jgi:probable DNA repair protein